ncbi:MAG: YcjX family protein [Rhodobacteraceae bacterium]|nr:YcjX family protein [Paracoccaceae bacterium]
MGIADIADQIARVVDDTQNGARELFEPVLRVGVTGLSRAGKTVFITSLVANLLDRSRMPGLRAEAEGRVMAAFLQPQPDDTMPRFAYETHLQSLVGNPPRWPESTSSISQLRLSLRTHPTGLLRGLKGPGVLHVDIVDYPGEWLLDLPLMKQSYAQWSEAAIALAQSPARAGLGKVWHEMLQKVDPAAVLDEGEAQGLAMVFTKYLQAARAAGFSNCAPGRFLLPGDLAGSPALTFAPLSRPSRVRSNTLYGAFERRFEAYKKQIVRPFFRDHFARIDHQIVLVDALGAIDGGPQTVEDLRAAMSAILPSFRPGKNHFLSMLTGKKVSKILFAATKADHIHHSQHPRLNGFLAALLADAKEVANWKGAETEVLSLAAMRATVEQTVKHEGAPLELVRGRLLDGGKEVALHPGDLPEDPERLLGPARAGDATWPEGGGGYELPAFAPPAAEGAPRGLAHIRMDRAAQFIIGDKL